MATDYCTSLQEPPIKVTVRISVLDEIRTVDVPRQVLCACSTYFSGALNWQTALTDSISLADDDPEAVAVFLYWLFNHSLPPDLVPEGVRRPPEPEADLATLTHVWIFADKYSIFTLANITMQAMVAQLQDRRFPLDLVEDIYASTADTSPLRRLAAVATAHDIFNRDMVDPFPDRFVDIVGDVDWFGVDLLSAARDMYGYITRDDRPRRYLSDPGLVLKNMREEGDSE